MSKSEGPHEGERRGEASRCQLRARRPVDVLVAAGRARTAILWLTAFSVCLLTIAILAVALKSLLHPLEPFLFARSYGCFVAFFSMLCGGVVVGLLDNTEGFKPRYSRFVARQAVGSLDKSVNSGVVLVEARIVIGQPDGSFFRPPLVLEDSSGARVYLPVAGELMQGQALEPLLGDRTSGALYRSGEAVVFVGSLIFAGSVAAPQLSLAYRDSGSASADLFLAEADWLAFKGTTREEVVKVLQQREMSRIPVVVGVLLLVASQVLSMVAFLGR